MAFDNFQKHCRECKKGQPCGKPHLYALELDSAILQRKWFSRVNPDYAKGMMCLYVGQTGHLPKCRASVHQNWVKGGWEQRKSLNLTYMCYCSGSMEKKKFTKKTGASPKVKSFNTYFLIGRLFKSSNPVQEGEDREEEEKGLADYLRGQGYGVWAGHHDSRAKG